MMQATGSCEVHVNGSDFKCSAEFIESLVRCVAADCAETCLLVGVGHNPGRRCAEAISERYGVSP